MKKVIVSIVITMFCMFSCKNSHLNWETFGKNCTTISYDDGNDKVSISYSGSFVINDNETAFESMSPDAFVYFEKGYRSFKAKSDKASKITYFINGEKVSFDENEKSMLKDIMKELSEFGFDADTKCRKLLLASGVSGIIEKIDGLKNDNVKNKYINYIFENGNPNADNIKNLLPRIRNIESDYDKACLLKKIKSEHLSDKETGIVFINTVTSIDSDFDKAGILKNALESKVAFEEQALTQALLSIESDYEIKQVLEQVISAHNFSPANIAMLCSVIKPIESDFEKANVLKNLYSNIGNDEVTIAPTIELIGGIESDFEAANVLKDLLKKGIIFKDENFLLLMNASANIESDFEKAGVLTEILNKNNVTSDQSWIVLLNEISTIESSFEKENVLANAVDKMPKKESIITVFKSIAKTLEDDTSYGKLTRSL